MHGLLTRAWDDWKKYKTILFCFVKIIRIDTSFFFFFINERLQHFFLYILINTFPYLLPSCLHGQTRFERLEPRRTPRIDTSLS